RLRARVETQAEFMNVQPAQACPDFRMPRLALDESLQAVADPRVLIRSAALLVAAVAKNAVGGRQLRVRLLLDGSGHGANERARGIRDAGHDTVGDVILHGEEIGAFELAVVGLRPDMRAGLRVDQLDVD